MFPLTRVLPFFHIPMVRFASHYLKEKPVLHFTSPCRHVGRFHSKEECSKMSSHPQFQKKLTLHFQISGVSLQLGPRTGEPLHPFAGAPKAPLRKTFECRAQNVTRWNANCHSFGVSLCFKKCHFGWGESPSGPL